MRLPGWMRWPRGKYNGQRIVGVSFKLKIDVTSWNWLPACRHGVWRFAGGFHWLCFWTWTNWEYESRCFERKPDPKSAAAK